MRQNNRFTTSCKLLFRITVCLLLVLPIAEGARAQSRVVQKWVDRVDQPVGGFGATTPVLATDANGNVYVAGNPSFNPNPSQISTTEFIEVEKYTSTGAKVWSALLKTPDVAPVANGIAVDSSGNVFVVGTGFENSPIAEFITAKLSSAGSIDWTSTYPFEDQNGQGYAAAVGIALDSAGNSYIAGWAQEDTAGPIVAIKYSPGGTAVWTKLFQDGNVDVASGMALDSSDNLFITGHISPCTNGCAPANTIGVTLKYNSSGTEVWSDYTGKSASLPPGTSTYSNGAVTVDSSGNAYVAGWNNTNGATCHPNPSKTVLCETGYAIKYGPKGNTAWETPGASWGSTAVALDREGDVYTAGSYFTSNSSHFSVTKLNPSGGLLWNEHYQHITTGDDEAFALAVNYDGDAYVTGQSTSTSDKTGLDYATLKFNSAGNLDWVAVYNGPGNGNDIASAITFSGADLYITGTSVGSDNLPGWATIDYLQDAAVVTPSSVTFPAQKIGTSSSEQSVTLTNSYSGEDLQLEGIDAHGPFSETNNCPSMLPSNASCTIKITFKPTAVGAATGSIDVYDQWAGSPAIIALKGTGTN